MPAEALPWVGIGAVIGVTTLDVADLCETIKDMQALEVAFGTRTPNQGDRAYVCGAQMPTQKELLLAVRTSPQNVWAKAKGMAPTIEDIQGIEWSGYTDWMGASLSGGADWAGSSAASIFATTRDGAAGAYRWSMDGAAGMWNGWFGDGEKSPQD